MGVLRLRTHIGIIIIFVVIIIREQIIYIYAMNAIIIKECLYSICNAIFILEPINHMGPSCLAEC